MYILTIVLQHRWLLGLWWECLCLQADHTVIVTTTIGYSCNLVNPLGKVCSCEVVTIGGINPFCYVMLTVFISPLTVFMLNTVLKIKCKLDHLTKLLFKTCMSTFCPPVLARILISIYYNKTRRITWTRYNCPGVDVGVLYVFIYKKMSSERGT